jgi:uroporphyrinogen III methyltransferase/synthase
MTGLTGRRVLVTRPRDQAASLCRRLRERYAIPVVFPTIAIRAADAAELDAELRHLDGFDWLVFTSVNGVRFVADRLAAVRPEGVPPTVRVAAVGSATARAAVEHGLPVHAVPDAFTGTAIPAALGDLRGRAVLLPRADIGREETGAALRAAGATLTEVVAYHTVPETPNADEWRGLRAGVDAVTFTSPSAVRHFAALLDDGERRRLDRAVIACIGGTTAAAARAVGFEVHTQPGTSTVDGLVAALDAHFTMASIPCL